MVKNYGRICSLVAPIRAQSKVRSDLKVGRFGFVARKSVSLPAHVLALGTHSQWPIGHQCTRSAYGALNKDGIFGNAIGIVLVVTRGHLGFWANRAQSNCGTRRPCCERELAPKKAGQSWGRLASPSRGDDCELLLCREHEIDFADPCDPLGRVKPSQWLRAKIGIACTARTWHVNWLRHKGVYERISTSCPACRDGPRPATR